MQLSPSGPDVDTKPRAAEPGASVGIFLALLAALLVFSYSSTPLLRYPDRAIGVGLMHGVDAARRFSIYLTIVAVVLGVWLGCHYGARWLQRVRPSWFSGVRSRLENDTCAMFAAVGSVAVVARVSADQLDHWAPVWLCLLGLGGVAMFALARRLSPWRWYAGQPGLPSALALIVLLAWPAPQIAGVIGDARGSEKAWLVPLVMFSLPLIYGLGLGYFSWRPGKAARSDVSRAFALGAAPLFAFPGLCPVANEIQYALAQRRVFEPRSIALGLLLLLVAIGALSFWRARAGKLRWAPRHVLARFVFPAIIFGEALLSVYAHTLNIKHVDPLHDGEQITAIHQLLAFDKWPFIDVWPAHGLFDYVGALYSVVNGFHPLEITAWNGLLSALSATAAYAVLARIATPAFAFAVAAVLPIEAILPLPQYSFFYAEPGLLAVGLLACLVLAKPSLRRHVLLSLAAFLCFFWTPASGVAAIAAASGLLVLSWITARERRPIARGIGAFAATGVAVFVVYVLVLLLRGQPILDTLRLIRAYIQADPLIGGRVEVIDKFDALAFLQYVLLPGIGIVYLVKLARHAIERRPLDGAERMLGFLTLVSFVLFARTLTRHGITERFQPFFFPLLALCIWMPQRRTAVRVPVASPLGDSLPSAISTHFWWRASARAWFCSGLALYLVWAQEPAPNRLAFDAFEFHAWKAGEHRFRGEAPEYPRLAAFLRATLRPGDTFLELLNMPVLYGLLDREMPGQFFLPTMFYATDSVQDSYLARLAAFGGSARVPVVLLPDEKGRNIDKIDNLWRSYRISEHVFREYVPLGEIDGFDVWISRSRWEEAAQSRVPRPLAFRDPSSYRAISVDPPRLEDGVLRVTATGSDPRVEDVADVKGLSLGALNAPRAVRFSYRTSVAGAAELFFRFAGGRYNAADSGRAMLATSPAGEWRSAEVGIPAQGDPTRAFSGLRIDPPDGATLEVRDMVLVFGELPPAEPQNYAVGMLPFFWANFDSRRALEKSTVLESIEVPAAAPLASFALKFRPIDDKASGNYLKLCIRLPELDVSTKAKRWTTVDHARSWARAGKVTLTFGAAPTGTFVFDLVQPQKGALGIPDALKRSFAEECKPYLVRISSQYAWSSQPISVINVTSTVPIVIESASLLAGD